MSLDYAGRSNPVANHTESHRLYPIQSLTFLQCCDEVDLCGCVLFYDLIGPIPSSASCSRQECQEKQNKTWKLSPTPLQHSEFYAVSQDLNCRHNKLNLFKMSVYQSTDGFHFLLCFRLTIKLYSQYIHISF